MFCNTSILGSALRQSGFNVTFRRQIHLQRCKVPITHNTSPLTLLRKTMVPRGTNVVAQKRFFLVKRIDAFTEKRPITAKVFRYTFRTTRVIALCVGVFVGGYFYGYATHAQDPVSHDSEQLIKFIHAHEFHVKGLEGDCSLPFVLVDLNKKLPAESAVPAYVHNVKDGKSQVHSIVLEDIPKPWGFYAHKARTVTQHVLDGARRVCTTAVALSNGGTEAEEIRQQAQHDTSLSAMIKNLENFSDMTQEDWMKASKLLAYDWEVVILATPTINAFVTPLQPRRIFVHSGLIDACENDSELAQVLGHELSHMILGHVEKNFLVGAAWTVVQMVVLSLLDPTGATSFLAETALFAGSSLGLLQLAYSRHNESEADQLGIIITAHACYDTSLAYKFFNHLQEDESLRNPSLLRDFFSTHPPDATRVEDLHEVANALREVHESPTCKQMRDMKEAVAKLWPNFSWW
eukprot:m.1638652 g.1638652  ORF g.1638652 m.1638652 type:complete len:462 (+) comp29652_c0_seq1:152-1537(+)